MNENTNNHQTISTVEYNQLRQKYIGELLVNAMSHEAREINPEVMKDFLKKKAEIKEKYKTVIQSKDNPR